MDHGWMDGQMDGHNIDNRTETRDIHPRGLDEKPSSYTTLK